MAQTLYRRMSRAELEAQYEPLTLTQFVQARRRELRWDQHGVCRIGRSSRRGRRTALTLGCPGLPVTHLLAGTAPLGHLGKCAWVSF